MSESQRVGFLGPGPVEAHITHAAALVQACPAPQRYIDVGAGGGVPGLPLVDAWPTCEGWLVDARRAACRVLEAHVEALEASARVHVVHARAEDAGRGPLRASADLVTARCFAQPAVTAECVAPLLAVGGVLAVAEPPDGAVDRWPAAALVPLGLEPGDHIRAPGATWRLLHQVRLCPDRFPRRAGVPNRRPLDGFLP